MGKNYQWFQFYNRVDKHINEHVIPQYGDFPDKMVEGYTPEKIQAKLEHYVERIGKDVRSKEEAIKDCYKIAHFACYLHAILTKGSAHPEDFGESGTL